MEFEPFTYQSVPGNPMWWFLAFPGVMLTLEYLVSLTSMETSRAKQAWTCMFILSSGICLLFLPL